MNRLRSVYKPILELQNLEESFLSRATAEYEARMNSEKFITETSEIQKQWGKTKSQDAAEAERRSGFMKHLSSLSTRLRLLSKTYQVKLKVVV